MVFGQRNFGSEKQKGVKGGRENWFMASLTTDTLQEEHKTVSKMTMHSTDCEYTYSSVFQHLWIYSSVFIEYRVYIQGNSPHLSLKSNCKLCILQKWKPKIQPMMMKMGELWNIVYIRRENCPNLWGKIGSSDIVYITSAYTRAVHKVSYQ